MVLNQFYQFPKASVIRVNTMFVFMIYKKVITSSSDVYDDFGGAAIPVWIRIPPHLMNRCIIDW